MERRSARILRMLNLPYYETTKGLSRDLRAQATADFEGLSPIQKFSCFYLIFIISVNTFDSKNTEYEKSTNNTELKNCSVTSSTDMPVESSILNEKENVSPDPSIINSSSEHERKSGGSSEINIISQIVIRESDLLSLPGPSYTFNTDTESKNELIFGEASLSNAYAESTTKNHEDGFESISLLPESFASILHTNSLEQKSPGYDSMSEDKTSGSEYVPSDNECPSSTSEEETAILSQPTDIMNKRNKTNMVDITSGKPTAVKKYKEKVVERGRNEKRKKRKSSMKHEAEKVSDSRVSRNFEEVTCSTMTSQHNIEIIAATKDEGKRIRDKGHACYFCQRIVQNLARHFELLHGKEKDVARILAMPKNSKGRRDGFANLIRVGDFYHNTDILATKKGQLILVRRPTNDEAKFVTPNDYGPCPHCLGFMLKKHLWHHVQNSCTAKNTNNTGENRHIIAESDALLNDAFGAEFSRDFVYNIISKLRDDDVGICCKEDTLIQRFGAMLFEKYGTTQCELIRQSMRQLARITLKLREIGKTKKTLSDFLVPDMFDLIIQATKSLCATHQNSVRRPEFDTPSLALKIGYALRKCAAIKRGRFLRAGNLSGNETLTSFLTLMDLEWNTRISSNALATLYNRKINATQLLPLTSDLMKLSKYLNDEIIKMQESLSECPTIKKWSFLASLTLSKIIIFNKRRSGEASRMTLTDYSSRPNWSNQCTEELKKSLSDFEKKLADQLTLVEIIGKRGRKVPVLLTRDMKLSIDTLNETRDRVDIAKTNPFVFARTGNSGTNLRGHDCLRKTCFDAGLEHAEYITSTKLRKYIATVCQVFNLSENEYDWLARHLGHDIRVHREFYRLHENAVELAKVSRLLIAVDAGDVNKFAGKSLEEINLEGK